MDGNVRQRKQAFILGENRAEDMNDRSDGVLCDIVNTLHICLKKHINIAFLFLKQCLSEAGIKLYRRAAQRVWRYDSLGLIEIVLYRLIVSFFVQKKINFLY